ncbi:DUF397 domain-containing protein [Amycolatopsis anabasis]|uniref:DUF397 domain-containing protein n=1 Tax=Amycolatopsis anabasis TaxID=1840409 RepID=UPI00131B2382|nr:DUF397 domain-containing protein [Amycolatopsis anabasis]
MDRAVWRKSSHSHGENTACVEVAFWRKSSHSQGENTECVEVAFLPEAAVAVRDSKNPTGPVLTYPPAAWLAFLASPAFR